MGTITRDPHIHRGLISGEELMKAPEVEYAVFDDMRGESNSSLHTRNGLGRKNT